MITDKDVEKLKKTFVTKDDFGSLQETVGDLKVEFAEMKEKMDTFQTTLDKVVGAINDMRTENSICTAWHQEHSRNIKSIAKQGKFKLA